ncbi:signal peptidase I [Pseudarthrobacter sp. LMD1-1-1.1]|uniref:signal peptidase I n=1 Tax=Pseudarthrobacter sp. LMD1-1-1.1 TaxID=3135242 RepID=UPI00341E8446
MSAAINSPSLTQRGTAKADGVGPRSGTRRVIKVLRRVVSWLATAMVFLAVAAFLALAVGPRVLGYQTSTMLTGSMAPLINPGDIVITRPVPVADIKVGDIITYHIPVEDQRVETHRVTAITPKPDGTFVVQTKGDANNGADPWLATISTPTVDRHALTVPHVGEAIRAIRQPLILNTLMYGAPALLVISMLAAIWRKIPEKTATGGND